MWSSYRAFEAYTLVAKRVALAHIRVGGVLVPFGALFSMEGALADDQRQLQGALIDIQKWFIYWVVYALWESIEAILFLRSLVPLYDLWRWGLSVWLVMPMITRLLGDDSGRLFDESDSWVAFTQLGAGLCYFQYLKPMIVRVSDRFKVDLSLIPSGIPDLVNLVNHVKLASAGPTSAAKDGGCAPPVTTSLALLTMEAVLDRFDSSYVMVNQLRERFTEKPKEAGTTTTKDELPKSAHANELGTHESDSLLAVDEDTIGGSSNNPDKGTTKTKKKKGWIW